MQTQLVKLECVVGEGTGEAAVESRVLLNLRAKKIADIQARLLDLSAEVVDCQVMVQGILHKQIFFVGDDDRVHHQAEDVPFAVFIDVPGAQPGMSARVQGRICKLTHTLTDARELNQRAILQFNVNVTEDCQVQVVLNPAGPLVRAEAVVGETTQLLQVENVVELQRPAIKVRDVRVNLLDVTAEVADDQVLIQGTLEKQIFFIATDNVEFHQEEQVPFSGIICIPGARPGNNVLIRPCILRVDRFLTNGNQVRQRVILSVFAKVTRPVDLNVFEDVTGPLAVASKVVAAASRQVLVENVADLDVVAKKITEIQARVTDVVTEVICNKVIIQGNLHKQIFFVGPDDVVHHQAEDIPFTTFVDVPGAQPFMTAQVTPVIEHISWHLMDPVAIDRRRFSLTDGGDRDEVNVAFGRLAQKTIIDVGVQVSQPQQIHLRALPVQPLTPTAVVPSAGIPTALVPTTIVPTACV